MEIIKKYVMLIIIMIVIGCDSISNNILSFSEDELSALKVVTTILSADSFNVTGSAACTNTSSSYSTVEYAFDYNDTRYCYTSESYEEANEPWLYIDVQNNTIAFEEYKVSSFATDGANGICSFDKTCQFSYAAQGDYILRSISYNDLTVEFTTYHILTNNVVTNYDYIRPDYSYTSTITGSGESQSIKFKINFNSNGAEFINAVEGTFTYSNGYDEGDLIMFSDGYATYFEDDTYLTETSPSLTLKWCIDSGKVAIKYIESDTFDIISDCSN